MSSLRGSVGRNAFNEPRDVRIIQDLLNRHIGKLTPYRPLVVDGIADANTIQLIEEFQRRVVGTKARGVIDPNDATFDALIEEVLPIVDYIVGEMRKNAASTEVRQMREYNSYSLEKCIADYSKLPWWKQMLGIGVRPEDCVNNSMSFKVAALFGWAMMVRQDGPWDHKPIIRHKFHPRSPSDQVWHVHKRHIYFYDVWSNLHYGFVGTAAGFSSSELLDGAGLEQIASDLLRRKLPTPSGTGGLRRFDDPSDRAAIGIGIRLYRTRPNQLTSAVVMDEVEKSPFLERKPYP